MAITTESESIKIKKIDEVSEANLQHINVLKERIGNIVPQTIKATIDFHETYLDITSITDTSKIDQAFVCPHSWTDSYEGGTFFECESEIACIVVREGNLLYKIPIHDSESVCSEKVIISENCKKIICLEGYSELYSWGYITTSNEFVLIGYAQYDPALGYSADVFGKSVEDGLLPWHNDVVLTGVTEFWYTYDSFFFMKEGNLYRINEDINIEGIQLIAKNVDVVILDGVSNSSGSKPETVLLVTKEGELYGLGRNSGYLLSNAKKSSYVFEKLVKVNVPFKVNDLRVVKGIGVYALDEANTLYYWGYPGYKNSFAEKKLKSNKYKDLLISYEKPILIAEDVSNITKKNKKINVFTNQGIYDSYTVVKYKNTKTNRYSVKVNCDNQQMIADRYLSNYLMIKSNKLLLDPRCLGTSEKYKWQTDVYVDNDFLFSPYWWITYGDYSLKGLYAAEEPYLIAEDVEDLSGRNYFKNGKWYQFDINAGSIEILSKKTKKMVSFEGRQIYLYNNKLYCSKEKSTHFAYKNKKNIKKQHNAFLMEKNISDFWANSGNIAFVKKGVLYSYGNIEKMRWKGSCGFNADEYTDEYADKKAPPNLVKYSGINTKNIANVCFRLQKMYIIMKSGDTYEITPKQKKNKRWYRKKCVIGSNMKLKQKNIKSIYQSDFDWIETMNLILKNNGKATVWEEELEDFEGFYTKKNTKRTIKKVSDFISSHCDNLGGSYYLVMENGDLYGWGENRCSEICTNNGTEKTAKDKIDIDDRKLIDTNVVKVSIPDNGRWKCNSHGIMYLKDDGKLYFRGYNDTDYCLQEIYDLN